MLTHPGADPGLRLPNTDTRGPSLHTLNPNRKNLYSLIGGMLVIFSISYIRLRY